jgi:dTDP-glucose 4,6-dehydratase
VYDEAKRFAEAITMAYHREHGVDVRVVRIFNTYGPTSAPATGGRSPNFLSQALAGEPLTVYGDGSRPARSPTSTTRSTAYCGCSSPAGSAR